MKPAKIIRVFLVVFLNILVTTSGFGKTKTEKPNILLIITDQQISSAMSCTGNKWLQTPAMDRLAESGVRFTRSYVTQPLCLPFRSSLQTSRYPHEIGTVNNGEDIKGEFPMLGNLVAAAGYQNDYFGKWHIGAKPENIGYKHYDNVGKDPAKTKRAVDYLLQKHDQPFFLTVSLLNPHNVCQLARAKADGSDLPDGAIKKAPDDLNQLPPLPDNFKLPENEPTIIRQIQEKSDFHYPTKNWSELTWRQYLWGYYRLVEKVDTQIGQVLDALEKGGYAKNTVVIFTSDHGEGVAMHHWNQKQILYDEATKVPLIINWPGITSKSTFNGLVSNALDVPSTILEIAGATQPESMHGRSLVNAITHKTSKIHDFVVAETMFARGAENLGATGRMIRTEMYKYCIYDNGDKREQLFNMQTDSGETNNLVYNPRFKNILNQHRKLITKWAQQTHDDNFPYIAPQQ